MRLRARPGACGKAESLRPVPLPPSLPPSLPWPGIAYNITAAASMQAVACPSGADTCSVQYWVFAVAFGGLQLLVSQLPNLDSLWQISALGTLMSFGCEPLLGGTGSDRAVRRHGPGCVRTIVARLTDAKNC